MPGGGRALRRACGLAILAVALALPATAGAFEVDVSATYFAFDPHDVEALSGDTVRWSNVSSRAHTVTSDDGSSFSSARLEPGDSFSHLFGQTGSFPYHCTIHPEITGTVLVADLILDGPAGPVDPGDPVTLHGRAHEGTGPVTIERDEGAGFAPLLTVPAAPDGSFDAQVTPSRTTRYRAVAGGAASPPLRILVFEHPEFDIDVNTSHAAFTIVHVHVLPKRPHRLVVIQEHLRDRFGWWPVGRGRLNNNSRARFKLPSTRAKARVVLTLGDAATILAESKPFRLR